MVACPYCFGLVAGQYVRAGEAGGHGGRAAYFLGNGKDSRKGPGTPCHPHRHAFRDIQVYSWPNSCDNRF